MASVHDVAAAILEARGPMTTMKLEKLVYYSQAVHLVRVGSPLFDSGIEAWANGPVCPDLYRQHRRRFEVSSWDGSPGSLDPGELESIAVALTLYADFDAEWLSSQSHIDGPWQEARGGLHPSANSNALISLDSIQRYYSEALADSDVEEALAADDYISPADMLARYAHLAG